MGGGIVGPDDLAFDSDGKLYFPAQGANEIWRVSLDGSREVLADLAPGLDNCVFIGERLFVSHITGGIFEPLGGGKWKPFIEAGFQWPMGLCVDEHGTVTIADGMFAYAIPKGGARQQIGTLFRGNYPGFLRGLASCGGGRVSKISGGKTETVLDGLGRPEGLACRVGKLYVLDVASKQVIECDLALGGRRIITAQLPVGAPPGVVMKPLGGVGDMCGPMTSFAGIAAGADGTLYVSADADGSVLAIGRKER